MMPSTVLCTVIFLACALTFSAAQKSCKGLCGADYDRGSTCQCDYNCISYDECCGDYAFQCTTKNSCKGRCGENFKRGRRCSCDADCKKYNQCCSDFQIFCAEEEEIKGAAHATAPVKTSSCLSVNDIKPTESIPDEPTELDSTFSEGNNEDDQLDPMATPLPYPQDDLSDDMYGQIFPSEGYPNNGMEDPDASPVPESTSDYGSPTADPLDQNKAEPTPDPDTVEPTKDTTPSDNEGTQASDGTPTLNPNSDGTPTLNPNSGEAPTESSDASDSTSSSDSGTTQPTPAAELVSTQPSATSAPKTELPPTANTPDLSTPEQAEAKPEADVSPEAQKTDSSMASTDMPEVATTASFPSVAPGSTDSSPGQENSKVTTVPASSTLDSTPIPEASTSEPSQDDTEINAEATKDPVLPDADDPSTSVSPVGSDLDALTTKIPTSTDAAQDDTTPDATAVDQLKVTAVPTKPTSPDATSKPQDKPEPHKPLPVEPALAKPGTRPEAKPLENAQTPNIEDSRDYQADDSNDTNLCSGRPVSAVTTLRNGTVVVFRGHYFWFLDGNRVPGPARGITQVWGVPSPIDTVFTRCNCQGKTYILKGNQYWRFENDALDTGYPKLIRTGFDGLQGHITAALSVPQYRGRRESVYFFKRGGLVQKYSYQFGTSPTCGRKSQYVYTIRNRVARQAVSALGPVISIRKSWKGFPSTITAAVSIPNRREADGYKYYVFSRSKSYNVRMNSERPVIPAPPANALPQTNNVFKCPKKV